LNYLTALSNENATYRDFLKLELFFVELIHWFGIRLIQVCHCLQFANKWNIRYSGLYFWYYASM